MIGPIDLRSDTVTQPTPKMREAISRATVGDDVYGEDPTVRALEEQSAERLGKEAGLFVPSGTMGNQIAVHLHTRPGTEVIGESRCHIFNYEMGAMSVISGALPRPVEGEDGRLRAADVERAIQPDTGYSTPTSLLVLENTHNLAGGTLVSLEALQRLKEVAVRHRLPIHMDGARIFNAAEALGEPVSRLVEPCDTVMFCLSKGLAAPVGSVLVGPRDLIGEARRIRKLLGGGMRQAGVLAAAGLVALETMVDRLGDDHRRAGFVAEQLATMPQILIRPELTQTNIVFFKLRNPGASAALFAETLASEGVLVHALGPDSIRLVTHYHIGDREIERAVDVIRTAVAD